VFGLDHIIGNVLSFLLECVKGLPELLSEVVGEINVTQVLLNLFIGVVSHKDVLSNGKSLLEFLGDLQDMF
jgi:hypothetical protein